MLPVAAISTIGVIAQSLTLPAAIVVCGLAFLCAPMLFELAPPRFRDGPYGLTSLLVTLVAIGLSGLLLAG
jgi:hypothetical protein